MIIIYIISIFEFTNETLHSVEGPGKSLPSGVASPQLYIIVNGKPTKLNVVWCTLINVDRVKAAITELKAEVCNHLESDQFHLQNAEWHAIKEKTMNLQPSMAAQWSAIVPAMSV